MSHPPITTLLYLQKTGVTWYDTSSNELAAIPLSDDCIRDMEVVNAEQIATLLEPHLAKHAATPGNAILIIDSPLVFSTTIPTTADSEEAIDNFLELVPFDMVAETQIHGQNATTVLATNQSLITAFRRILHKYNIALTMALPLGIYDTSNQQLTPLAASTAQMLIDQASQLASYSLIQTSPITKPVAAEQGDATTETTGETVPTHKPSYAENEKKKPHTLKVLVPLFALLVLVLVGMLIWQRQPPTRPTSTLAQASQPTQTTTAPPTTTATTPDTSAPVNTSTIAVQVLAAQDGLERAKEIGATFSQAGFQVLPDTQQTAISTSQTIIFIDATYPKSVRDRVETLLKKHVQTYSVQEADSPANGVTIILGSSE